MISEAMIQEQLAYYIRRKYPDVLFHSDFGSGIKLTPGQAAKQKRQNGGQRAWPDMFIAETIIWYKEEGGEWEKLSNLQEITDRAKDLEKIGGRGYWDVKFGLFIELKKEGTRLKKKNGEWATEHIAEQAKVLNDLRERGYCAEFAVGFDEAKAIVDKYLGGENNG